MTIESPTHTRVGTGSKPVGPHRGTPDTAERARLAGTLGAVLVAERRGRGWTQAQLAEQAGVSRATVERLERGARRPSAGMSWRLARALRNTSTMRDQVALDARLRMVAGASLRQFNTRPHRRRARMEAELAKGSGVPVTDADDFGAFTSALLALGF